MELKGMAAWWKSIHTQDTSLLIPGKIPNNLVSRYPVHPPYLILFTRTTFSAGIPERALGKNIRQSLLTETRCGPPPFVVPPSPAMSREGISMDPNQILSMKRGEILALAKRFGIKNIHTFGSVARREAWDWSDIDLPVGFPPGITLITHVTFQRKPSSCWDALSMWYPSTDSATVSGRE